MNIIIWGGAGQCQAAIPILKEQKHTILAIFDKTPNLKSPYQHIPLYLDTYFDEWIIHHSNSMIKSVIAIGNPHAKKRIKISNWLKIKHNITSQKVIHPKTIFGQNVSIENNIQILANSNIRENVYICSHCILNCNSLIEHNCRLEDGVEIGPGAILCGNIWINKYTWIGAGATILPNLEIGKNCIIGAGSVVTKNVPDNSIMIGNPARFMRYNND